MLLSAQARFDADVPTVLSVLADEQFVTAKLRASGATSEQVDVVGTPDDAFTVTTRRQMPVDDIPPQFRSFVGRTLEVRQVEAWDAPSATAADDGRHGTVVVEITGAPVRLSGTLRLVPDDGGSTVHLDGDVKASIPLFGGAVEEAVAGAVRQALAAEERTVAQWLAGRRG